MRMQTLAMMVGVLVCASPAAWGAPCATACKDEVKSCVSQECVGLKPAARMRCKRTKCSKPIVKDCYTDLSVCGATQARPSAPAPSKPPPAGGGGW